MSDTAGMISTHVYAWAKTRGLDDWLTTADYDDLIGRLSAEVRTEWTWRHNQFIAERDATTDRAEAERNVERCRAANSGHDVSLASRTVTP